MRVRRVALVLFAVVAVSAAAGCSTVVPSGTPPTNQDTSAEPSLRFANVSAGAGLSYTSAGIAYGHGNEGVYVADINNDHWPDLLTIGGESPALFVNTGGAFERSGKLPSINGTVQGALLFDYDADGWVDLLLLRRHAVPVVLENRDGSFVRRDPAALGLDVRLSVPTGATANDYDRDGDLDLFVIQSGNWRNRTPAGYHKLSTVPPGEGNGAPNLLFENTGDGFERVADAGIRGEHWSLAASFVDLTGDGYPDIHVANDYNNDTLYLNRGDGTFERIVLGAATDRNGMASEVFDVNRDGRPDVFVTNIDLPIPETKKEKSAKTMILGGSSYTGVLAWRLRGNNLLVNRGNGTFVDRAAEYGVRTGGWGWAAVAADFDDDGDRDLFHSTSLKEPRNETRMDYSYPKIWERRGDQYVRLNASAIGLEDANGRGAAALDFDRDGDLDLAVATLGSFVLYENRADGGHSVDVLVRGATGIGARVTVIDGEYERSAIATLNADYESQDTRVLHFGLGERKRVDRIRVTFRDGRTRVIENVSAGTLLVVGPEDVRRIDRDELRGG